MMRFGMAQTILPAHWLPVIERAREFSGSAQLWFLRTVSAYNYSLAQEMAKAIDPQLAAPLVPSGLSELPAMIAGWLNDPALSAVEKEAVVIAWRMMDPGNCSALEANPLVHPNVRLLLKSVRG